MQREIFDTVSINNQIPDEGKVLQLYEVASQYGSYENLIADEKDYGEYESEIIDQLEPEIQINILGRQGISRDELTEKEENTKNTEIESHDQLENLNEKIEKEEADLGSVVNVKHEIQLRDLGALPLTRKDRIGEVTNTTIRTSHIHKNVKNMDENPEREIYEDGKLLNSYFNNDISLEAKYSSDFDTNSHDNLIDNIEPETDVLESEDDKLHHPNDKHKDFSKHRRGLELDINSMMEDCKALFGDISEEECIGLQRKLGISDEQLSDGNIWTPIQDEKQNIWTATQEEKQNRKREVTEADILQLLPYNFNNVLQLCKEETNLGSGNLIPYINSMNSQIPYNPGGLNLMSSNIQQQQQQHLQQQALTLSQIQQLLNAQKLQSSQLYPQLSPQSMNLDLQNINQNQLQTNAMLGPLLQNFHKNANTQNVNDISKLGTLPANTISSDLLVGGYPNFENNQNLQSTDLEPFIKQKLIENQNLELVNKIDELKQKCALDQLNKYLENNKNNQAQQSQIARTLSVHQNSKREPGENDPNENIGLKDQGPISKSYVYKNGGQARNQAFGENALVADLNGILGNIVKDDDNIDHTPEKTIVIDNSNLKVNGILSDKMQEDDTMDRTTPEKTIVIDNSNREANPLISKNTDENEASERAGFKETKTTISQIGKSKYDHGVQKETSKSKKKENANAKLNNNENIIELSDHSRENDADKVSITAQPKHVKNDSEVTVKKHPQNELNKFDVNKSSSAFKKNKTDHTKTDKTNLDKIIIIDNTNLKENPTFFKNKTTVIAPIKITEKSRKSSNHSGVANNITKSTSKPQSDEVKNLTKHKKPSNKKKSKEDLDVHTLSSTEDGQMSKEELVIHAPKSAEDDQKSEEEFSIDTSKDADIQNSKEELDVHESNSAEYDQNSEEYDEHSLNSVEDAQITKEELDGDTTKSDEHDQKLKEELDVHTLKSDDGDQSSKEELGLQESKSVEHAQNSIEETTEHLSEKSENHQRSKEDLVSQMSKSAEDQQKSKEDLGVNSPEHDEVSSTNEAHKQANAELNFAPHMDALENSKKKTIV